MCAENDDSCSMFPLLQWDDNQTDPSTSWRDLYFTRPLIPVDFLTIQQALQAKTRAELSNERPAVTILLCGGKHRVANPIHMDTNKTDITIEALRQDSVPHIVSTHSTGTSDEPLFRVSQGSLTLRGLHLQHKSQGADLWSGNAAVFVEPMSTATNTSVSIQGCSIRSASGRGVAVMGSASIHVSDCCIHNCAATGVYVAGQDAQVSISHSDLVRNGQGNSHNGGVRRGHSGVYLEAGEIAMDHCSVMRNTASGLSVVAAKTLLTLADSDVMANERVALDVSSLDVGRFVKQTNNRLSTTGIAMVRSSVLRESPEQLQVLDDESVVPDDLSWMDFVLGEVLQ